MEAPWGDEFGFFNPELASTHACTIQGGFSDPENEAGRMIKDGGIGADRARAWLKAEGLEVPGGEPYSPTRDLATVITAMLPGSDATPLAAAASMEALIAGLSLSKQTTLAVVEAKLAARLKVTA